MTYTKCPKCGQNKLRIGLCSRCQQYETEGWNDQSGEPVNALFYCCFANCPKKGELVSVKPVYFSDFRFCSETCKQNFISLNYGKIY